MASDVAKAAESAEKKDVRAEEKAEKTDAAVTNELSKDVDKANAKEVSAAADDAVIQAEGENKVALAKCEALAGDAQKACKSQAQRRARYGQAAREGVEVGSRLTVRRGRAWRPP